MLLDSLKFNLLGYDLILYVLEYYKLEWKSEKHQLYKGMVKESVFDDGLGISVCTLMAKKGKEIYECYTELYEKCQDADVEVGTFAMQAVPFYFPDGYTHENFLAFCAMVCGVTKLFFEVFNYEVADSAADAIASVLTTYSMTNEFQDNGGMKRLVATGTEFCKCLQRKVDMYGYILKETTFC